MTSKLRIYRRNEKNILLQIIRTDEEWDKFMNLEKGQMIDNLTDFKKWKDGDAPFNKDTISFGIEAYFYEKVSGNIIRGQIIATEKFYQCYIYGSHECIVHGKTVQCIEEGDNHEIWECSKCGAIRDFRIRR